MSYEEELREKGFVISIDAKDVLDCEYGDDSTMSDNAVQDFTPDEYDRLSEIMNGINGKFSPDMAHVFDDVRARINEQVREQNRWLEQYGGKGFNLDSITVEKQGDSSLAFYKDGVQFGETYVNISVNEDRYMDNEVHDALMPDGTPASSINNTRSDWEYFEELGTAIRERQEENDFADAVGNIPGPGSGLEH